jgi:hypothetical protein
MSIINNETRVGNFTSSNIVKLLSKGKAKDSMGKPALTYIQEKNMERILGRSITTESDARPLQWGKMCESLVFEQLSMSYTLCSQETLQHPTIPYWTGSPDGVSADAVIDIKCPLTLKSYFLLTQGENIYSMIDGFSKSGASFGEHSDGDKFYWQLISNAILTGKKFAELIVFIPYLSQLQDIRDEAEVQGINWIYYASDDELPYIHEGKGLTNITTIRFEIPQKDIDLLTESVIEAGKLLITPYSGVLLTPQQDGVIIAEKL